MAAFNLWLDSWSNSIYLLAEDGPAAYKVPCAVANVGAQHGDI